MPQKGSVDGVIRFREVDKAQVQGGVLLPRQFLHSSYNELHVTRRELGSEPTLFFRQCFLAFAIVTQATRLDFEEYFAGVSHEQEATISATLSPILLVKRLNGCIFPMLRYATSHPSRDDDIVEPFEGVQFLFVGQNLQELGRDTVEPYRLSVRQCTDRLLYFVPRRGIVQWSKREPLRNLVYNARIKGQGLNVKHLV